MRRTRPCDSKVVILVIYKVYRCDSATPVAVLMHQLHQIDIASIVQMFRGSLIHLTFSASVTIRIYTSLGLKTMSSICPRFRIKVKVHSAFT